MSLSPETLATPQAQRASGLRTCLLVIVSPGEAFAALSRVPTWGWAAIIAIALVLVSVVIVLPVSVHYAQVTQARALSQMPAEQAAAAREFYAKIPQWTYAAVGVAGAAIGPWISWIIIAAVLLAGAALSGGNARFGLAWAASVNAYLVVAIGSLANSAIIALRGPESVSTASDLYGLPSLAMLVHGSPKVVTLLYAFNVVNVWFLLIAAIALERTLGTSRGAAIGTVAVLALLGVGAAGVSALFVR